MVRRRLRIMRFLYIYTILKASAARTIDSSHHDFKIFLALGPDPKPPETQARMPVLRYLKLYRY